MNRLDTTISNDEQLLLDQVICGDAELLYLDALLADVFRPRGVA